MRKIIIIILAMVLIIGISPYNKVEAVDDEGDEKTGRGIYDILKDKPKIIATTPIDGERYFDPERLKFFMDSDDEGYYIKVIFENIGGRLEIINQMESGITVYIEGENENWLDQGRDFKFTSSSDEFILYIPLKDKPADGQIYNVTIPTNIAYEFTFDTNYLPMAKELYEGSVAEFYDYNYPIVIDGSSFRRDTRVRFKGMDGRIYNPDGLTLTRENNRLYIFLPRYPRLPVGLYDIIISNGYNYDTEMSYGVFSVVEQGDYIPNEKYRLKEKNITKGKLEINLDELMGEEVWVRTIEYPAKRSDYLGELILKSRWANINIMKLRLQEDPNENKIKVRGGRVEPGLSDIIKKQIVSNNVKSNFIELSGENFDFDNITIEIPYFESDGTGLKMLRYDEDTRSFEDVKFTRDLVEGKLRGFSQKTGIFVIVD